MIRYIHNISLHVILILGICCCMLLITGTELNAQSLPDLPHVSDNMAITVRKESDGIHLRWAPADFTAWIIGARQGWVLERAVWEPQNFPLDRKALVFSELGRFKAMEKEDWERNLNIRDTAVAMAAQALWGDESSRGQADAGFAAARITAEQQAIRHAIGMLAADFSADAARGLGLAYVDKDLVSGTNYIYRLRLENNKAGYGADTVFYHVTWDGQAEAMPEVANVQTHSLDGAVMLQWPKELNRLHFTAYHVERSLDGRTFTRLTERPVTAAEGDDQGAWFHWVDSSALIGKKYTYRVLGITPFARWSSGASLVQGTARDMEAPLPPQDITVSPKGTSFVVDWVADAKTLAPDATGWKVKRSQQASGPFAEIHDGVLPLRQRSFTDPAPMPLVVNYYKVYSVDTAGNENPSILRPGIWQDETPPAPPRNLQGSIDTLGWVALQWDASPEVDWQGYRIFMRDDRNKSWYQLTDTLCRSAVFSYQVASGTLSKGLEFTVAALDMHYNVSDYATPLRLALPDLVPPVTPRWANWQMRDTSVFLSWYPSASSDVAVQHLLQRTGEGAWVRLREMPPITREFSGSRTGSANVQYALLAIDSSGNASDTLFLRNLNQEKVRTIDGIKGMNVRYLADEKAMEITWEYPPKDDVVFLLYRKDNNGQDLEGVGLFDAKTRKHVDKGPTAFADGFSYFIKVRDMEGAESPASDPFKVRFRQ
jgi:uncharacterized protein